jgi:hypothetical protein
MKTTWDRQLGAAITVRLTLRAGLIGDGMIIMIQEKCKLP